MSRLTIVDLSFCDEFPDISSVQGGVAASVSTSFQAANSAQYYGNWSIIKSPSGYGIVANISATAAGSAAGATAGAASDGSAYSNSFARATAY